MRTPTDPLMRAVKFIDFTQGSCWLWTGSTSKGYAYIRSGGRGTSSVLAHRLIYKRLVGEIPEGLQLDHLCRVTTCVNPAHLEPVTPRENLMRGLAPSALNARKNSCKRGHPFDDSNTYTGSNGGRICRTCARENKRRSRAAAAGKAGSR